MNLQVIPSKASGQGISTIVTPHIAKMELATYEDDFEMFRDAYKQAVDAYAKLHPDEEDPGARVKESFRARHPLNRVFRVQPTEAEYRRILENLNDTGSEAVSSGVNQFNKFLQKLGAKPNVGKKEKPKSNKPMASNLGLLNFNAANTAYASSFLD